MEYFHTSTCTRSLLVDQNPLEIFQWVEAHYIILWCCALTGPPPTPQDSSFLFCKQPGVLLSIQVRVAAPPSPFTAFGKQSVLEMLAHYHRSNQGQHHVGTPTLCQICACMDWDAFLAKGKCAMGGGGGFHKKPVNGATTCPNKVIICRKEASWKRSITLTLRDPSSDSLKWLVHVERRVQSNSEQFGATWSGA